MKTVCVLGLGYIGLPTSAVLAARGARVFGVDVNPHVVQTINEGRIHIVEPELDEFVRSAVGSGRLSAHSEPQSADVFVIAVPTPFTGDHKPDISYVEAATRALAPFLASGALVVLESTSPVGTTERVAQIIAEMRPDLRSPLRDKEGDVHVAHCPERVLPGHVIRELVENDRVIGGVTPACTEAALTFYRSFVTGQCLATSARTAEMCKLTENAFRDVNIAFANELSIVCDRLDIDVWELIGMANRHPRVNILQPGCGVGGHCIAVDPWFIIDSAPDIVPLMRAGRQVNDGKPHYVIEQVARELNAQPSAKVACLGLTYKPDVDDFRESPALEIALELNQRFPGRVIAVDPFHEALSPAWKTKQSLHFAALDEALAEASIITLLVSHSEFRQLPRPACRVFDCVGLWR